MLEVQSAEILDDIKLNIVKRKTKKTQIFLYDTQRRSDDFMMKLQYRYDGKYDDIPHFIVTKQGKIIQVFDMDYSSKTFESIDIGKKQIKIALENLGWLNKNTITGVLYNWIGDPYRGEPYIKKWRNYYFWDPYTGEQLNALVILCKNICESHGIPYHTVPSQGYLSNVIKFTGIVCKSNFLNIYCDIHPSFDFNIFYKDDNKQTD